MVHSELEGVIKDVMTCKLGHLTCRIHKVLADEGAVITVIGPFHKINDCVFTSGMFVSFKCSFSELLSQ